MAKQTINVGTSANDGSGDTLRDAMVKVNANFTELYNTAPILTNLTVGNSSVNTFANSSYLRTTNGAFTDSVRVGNSSVYSVVNGTFFSATAHNADRLGGAYANQYINVTSNFTLSGILTFNDDIVLGANARIVANSSGGSNGDVLSSNGTAVYWSTPLYFDSNTSYTWSNTQTFQKSVSFSNNVSVSGNLTISKAFSANGSTGTSGYVLTSSGTGNVYWSTGSLSLNSNTTSTSNFYFPMTASADGLWSNGVVANNSLFFKPSTGLLSVTSINATSINCTASVNCLSIVANTINANTIDATTINSLSDKNKKTEIEIIEDAIEIVTNLNGVRFIWKETGEKSAGLLAQDVEKKMPELVKTDSEGIKTLNYSGVIAVLVEAVKYLLEKDKENR